MPYTASIDRRNPGCFLFLIDQSHSMRKGLAGQTEQPKINAAADAVNRAIDNIALRCSQGLEIRDYFDIGILGYGYAQVLTYEEVLSEKYIYHIEDDGKAEVWKKGEYYDPEIDGPIVRASVISVLPGASPESPFLSIGRVAEIAEFEERQARESDGAGGVVEVTRRFPVWLRPHTGTHTPMCEALAFAGQAVEQWIARHPDSFPPIVINISDGEATDGDPEPIARQIMELSTSDGNALMFNCHLSELRAAPAQYPGRERGLPGEHARRLFRMSPPMPPGFRAHAETLDIRPAPESRCYVFNADLVSLVQFLDIGTRAAANLR